MKLFLDTNIFLDLILRREHFEDALLIFNAIEKKLFSGVMLDITILNIDYIASKQVTDIKDFLKLLNTHIEIVGVTNSMVAEALTIDNKDLEDTLQYLSARNAQCEIIISNDKNFYRGDIETLSSDVFVQRYL